MRTAPAFDAPVADWLVFADWLQTQGDAKGELIGLMHAGDEAKREAFVRANAPALLGEAAAYYGSGLSLRWRWCFVEEAEVRGLSAEDVGFRLEALLMSPAAARLQSLRLVGVPDGQTPLDLSAIVARLAGGAGVPEPLSSLTLIDQRAANSTSLTSRDFDPGDNLVDFGPMAPLWAMKSLRKLKLVVADTQQLVPGAVDAPQLTSLTIHGLRFAHATYGDAADPSELARALAVAKLPRLEEFDLRLCEEWVVNELDDTGAYTSHDGGGEDGDNIGDNEGADWDGEFGDALRTLVKSPLKRLALTSFDSTSELLGLIRSTGLPATLKELDLSDSSLSHADVDWFTANKALLASLEKLVVKDTSFTPTDVAVLAGLGPKVEYSPRDEEDHRSSADDDDEGAGEPLPLPKYRYIVGME